MSLRVFMRMIDFDMGNCCLHRKLRSLLEDELILAMSPILEIYHVRKCAFFNLDVPFSSVIRFKGGVDVFNYHV